MKQQFEFLSKYLPIITVLAIGIGYVNLHTTYYPFGINIYPYLEASEILLSFASLILELVSIFILTVVYSYVLITNIGNHERQENEKFIQGLKPIHRALVIILAGFSITFVALLQYFNFVFVIVVIPLVYLLKWMLKNWISAIVDRTNLFVTSVFILFCIYMIVGNIIKADGIKNGRQKQSVTLHLANETSVSTDQYLMYVGSVRNYIFFWDRKSKKNIVISTSLIKSLEIMPTE